MRQTIKCSSISDQDFSDHQSKYLELTDSQLKKLKQLTLIHLASAEKHLSYVDLQRELGIENVRALEDLIIDSIYAVM